MAKTKGAKGGNPHPVQTAEFFASQFKAQGAVEGELAKKPLSIKVTSEVDAAIRSLPQRAAWLRRVITEAAELELMGNDSEPAMVKDRSESIATTVDKPTRKRKKRGDE